MFAAIQKLQKTSIQFFAYVKDKKTAQPKRYADGKQAYEECSASCTIWRLEIKTRERPYIHPTDAEREMECQRCSLTAG